MEQPVGIASRGADVAMGIRDDEGVSGFEGAAREGLDPGRRDIERSLRGNLSHFHQQGTFDGHDYPRARVMAPLQMRPSRISFNRSTTNGSPLATVTLSWASSSS